MLTIIAIYRPTNVSNLLLLDEFLEVDSWPIAMDRNIIIAGNFNLHVNNPNDDDSCNFIDAMTTLVLKQHIQFPYLQVR